MPEYNDMSEALADARRAYRIVWAYQRRMMDAVQTIIDVFPETAHYWWGPMHYQRLPSRATTDPLDGKWAWDGLPLYSFSLLRLPLDASSDNWRPTQGQWMLEITHEADDGWNDDQSGEPDARHFSDATDTASSLTVNLWRCDRDLDQTTWSGAWSEAGDRPEGDEWSGIDHPYTEDASGLTWIGHYLDLSSVEGAEDVRTIAQEIRRAGKGALNLPF